MNFSMDSIEDVILKKEIIINEELFDNMKEPIHISFGIDANFARGMGVLITSIILNNQSQCINFHVLTDGINRDDIERLNEFKKYKNVKIIIYYIDARIFNALPKTDAWSQAIYYRFIMGRMLKGVAKRVLYLDADILCVGSLFDLINMDMDSKVVIAVNDCFKDIDDRIKELSLKNGKYFNSGFMYIDIDKWDKENVAEKSISLLIENPHLYRSFDQDVLNIILDGKVCFVDRKWNLIYNLSYMKYKFPDKVALVHFTGDKPWQKWTEHHFIVKIYHEYMLKSPWYDVPLSKPVHYKEKRRMARSYANRNNYTMAFLWFLKYLIARVLTKFGS